MNPKKAISLLTDKNKLKNEALMKDLRYYERVSDIIKRTYAAMGRNQEYETSYESTLNVSTDERSKSKEI